MHSHTVILEKNAKPDFSWVLYFSVKWSQLIKNVGFGRRQAKI